MIRSTILVAFLLAHAPLALPSQGGAEIKVFKSASCGCCKGWVEHVRGDGMAVQVQDSSDMEKVKRDLGVPAALVSCHTATVGGYVIEGHVPASSVRKLLQEHPNMKGIAVRGMPQGSPGMNGVKSGPIEVVSFDKDGNIRPFDRW